MSYDNYLNNQKLTKQGRPLFVFCLFFYLIVSPVSASDFKSPQELFIIALEQVNTENYQEAIDVLRKLIKKYPDFQDAYPVLWRVNEVVARAKESIYPLKKDLLLGGGGSDNHFKLVIAYWHIGKCALSISEIRSFLKATKIEKVLVPESKRRKIEQITKKCTSRINGSKKR